MKVFLRDKQGFHPETARFYEENFPLTDEKDADVVVINDFRPMVSGKTVACNSTGLDHIKAPKIISLRGEDLSDLTAVPELCLGMAIYLTRVFRQEEIRGKTLGLIGFGRIAHLFGAYAELLGVNVIWFDKNSDSDLEVSRKRTLEDLLKESDIVSLHITADEENRGFMGPGKFDQMKPGAIFLNSSRPWLVDDEALRWALANRLAAAWMDFLTFPNSSDHQNLVCTDHLGGTTKESKLKSEMIIARRLKAS